MQTIKTLNKHYDHGGRQLDTFKVGQDYDNNYTVSGKDCTRTRKSLWIHLELTLTKEYHNGLEG